ncbi:MAG: primosomal replication protein N [Candidatus Protistobacter heckmanni]|nr:primosomal replication protein N [Candidatus Protistobacter heckmanni]
MNRVEFSAVLIEKDALRHTPAGIPLLNCLLRHEGEAQEAGHGRRIELDLQAVAVGRVSAVVNRLSLGQEAEFVGFLARKRMNSKMLVLHITECRPAPTNRIERT